MGLIYTSVVGRAAAAIFQLRNKALSPALTEARLQALQARIRPHFLFNSINAVLSLIRSEPRKAERALEDLAGTVSRTDGGKQARCRPSGASWNWRAIIWHWKNCGLGERLKIDWHTDKAPMQAAIPPLILQPLLETGVSRYRAASGSRRDQRQHLPQPQRAAYRYPQSVSQQTAGSHHIGNKMALANIRERLALFLMRSQPENHVSAATVIRYILFCLSGSKPWLIRCGS